MQEFFTHEIQKDFRSKAQQLYFKKIQKYIKIKKPNDKETAKCFLGKKIGGNGGLKLTYSEWLKSVGGWQAIVVESFKEVTLDETQIPVIRSRITIKYAVVIIWDSRGFFFLNFVFFFLSYDTVSNIEFSDFTFCTPI